MNLLLLLLIIPAMIFGIMKFQTETDKAQPTFCSKLFFTIYLFSIFIFLLTFIGKQYNIYIKGYRSTSILFVLMSVLGIIYWFVDRQRVSKNIFRVCLFGFCVVTISVSSLLTFELIGDYKNQLVYNDSRYRLEETGRWIMNPCTLPTLFVKYNFYEKEYIFPKSYCITKSQIKSVEVKSISTNKVSITYFLTNDIFEDTPNPLNIIYCDKQ